MLHDVTHMWNLKIPRLGTAYNGGYQELVRGGGETGEVLLKGKNLQTENE